MNNKKRSSLRKGLPFMVIALCLIMALPAHAADNVQATLTADKNELTVGDPVQLTLQVTHPTDHQAIIPKLEQTWGDLEVRGQSEATTTPNDDGTATTRATIEVTLFDLGTFETPALPITVSDGAGQIIEETAQPISLTVKPVLAEDDTTLKDIKPQAGLVVPPVWPALMGGLLVAAVVALGGWWVYRRRRGERLFGLKPVVDNRPPYQVAYDELARIEGLKLPQQGHFKGYYTLVTDCLRTYLESQFHIHAFERTTSELRLTLRQTDIAPDQVRQFVNLFTVSDFVKFARLKPEVETAQQLMGDARELVDLTRPRPNGDASAEEGQPAPSAATP